MYDAVMHLLYKHTFTLIQLMEKAEAREKERLKAEERKVSIYSY